VNAGSINWPGVACGRADNNLGGRGVARCFSFRNQETISAHSVRSRRVAAGSCLCARAIYVAQWASHPAEPAAICRATVMNFNYWDLRQQPAGAIVQVTCRAAPPMCACSIVPTSRLQGGPARYWLRRPCHPLTGPLQTLAAGAGMSLSTTRLRRPRPGHRASPAWLAGRAS